jgi:hypothetical protein
MTYIKTVETKKGKKYFRFSYECTRLFPISKIEVEKLISLWQYKEFLLY